MSEQYFSYIMRKLITYVCIFSTCYFCKCDENKNVLNECKVILAFWDLKKVCKMSENAVELLRYGSEPRRA